jgi:hypothetical protein
VLSVGEQQRVDPFADGLPIEGATIDQLIDACVVRLAGPRDPAEAREQHRWVIIENFWLPRPMEPYSADHYAVTAAIARYLRDHEEH